MSGDITRNDTYDARIAQGASNQEKDGAIWKAYSKRGGFHDALQDFCQAVKKPSANAFDYDESEGTYIICIALYNTIWMRLDADMGKLHESLLLAEQKRRNYVPATHKKVYVRIQEVPEKIVSVSGRHGILPYLRAFDKWMMRFKPYAAIHDLIEDLFSSQKKTAVVNERHEETKIVYDESALELAEYKMKYSQLLDVLSDVMEDIGRSLRPIRQEDEKKLERYHIEAQRICGAIEANVFSRREWML